MAMLRNIILWGGVISGNSFLFWKYETCGGYNLQQNHRFVDASSPNGLFTEMLIYDKL